MTVASETPRTAATSRTSRPAKKRRSRPAFGVGQTSVVAAGGITGVLPDGNVIPAKLVEELLFQDGFEGGQTTSWSAKSSSPPIPDPRAAEIDDGERMLVTGEQDLQAPLGAPVQSQARVFGTAP